DYAVTKRQRLLRAGWPSGALRIATARTSTGIGHAVLVVSTSQGDLVLDNRTNVVKPWKAVDLKWIKIQSHENPRVWLKL
ncbi:transglutaminase-like cysteine peptidase, partial [Agrobacterium tumefaciens]